MTVSGKHNSTMCLIVSSDEKMSHCSFHHPSVAGGNEAVWKCWYLSSQATLWEESSRFGSWKESFAGSVFVHGAGLKIIPVAIISNFLVAERNWGIEAQSCKYFIYFWRQCSEVEGRLSSKVKYPWSSGNQINASLPSWSFPCILILAFCRLLTWRRSRMPKVNY